MGQPKCPLIVEAAFRWQLSWFCSFSRSTNSSIFCSSTTHKSIHLFSGMPLTRMMFGTQRKIETSWWLSWWPICTQARYWMTLSMWSGMPSTFNRRKVSSATIESPCTGAQSKIWLAFTSPRDSPKAWSISTWTRSCVLTGAMLCWLVKDHHTIQETLT